MAFHFEKAPYTASTGTAYDTVTLPWDFLKVALAPAMEALGVDPDKVTTIYLEARQNNIASGAKLKVATAKPGAGQQDDNTKAWVAHVATLNFAEANKLFSEWNAAGHSGLVRAVKAGIEAMAKAPAGNVPQAPASVTPKAPASVPQAPGRKGKGG